MLEPDDLNVVVVGFLKSEMDHVVFGGCSVPVEFTGENGDSVTGADELRGLAMELDEADSRQDVKGLADGVSVPGGARSGSEGDASRAEPQALPPPT